MNKIIFFVIILASSTSSLVHSAVDTYEFDDETTRSRYQLFIEEMRCPKCQNQNLAGSNSPIAADLRRELQRLLNEGQSDSDIIEYMVSRYGDFVLYNPRVQSNTLVLWSVPFVLMLIGFIVLIRLLRGNKGGGDNDGEMTPEKYDRLNNLLSDDEPEADKP
ncbi:MAG: cytochrome c-type biogenesis protein [Porticoccus sp.]